MTPPDGAASGWSLLRYAIRDGELGAGDSPKLRVAYELGLPLIWFQGVRDGVFVPAMPVFGLVAVRFMIGRRS